MKILALTSTENESGAFSYLPLLMLGIGVATMYINLHIMVSSSIFYLCRIVLLFLNPNADDLFGMARYPELGCPLKLVSIETTQTGTETTVVSALSETKCLFWLFRFYTETESFDVSENLGLLRFVSVCYVTELFVSVISI